MFNARRATALTLLAAMLLAASSALAGEGTVYGEGLTDVQSVTLADLLDHPDTYVGKKIRVQGRIADVCPHMGCWIEIEDEDARSVRFKVDDGVIVFPVKIKGKQVEAEGVFTREELTREQAISRAEHHAEEKGESFDPSTIEGPVVFYQIRGIGAVVR